MAGEIAAQIGRRIRQRRLELGWNQRQLAERIPESAVDNQRVSDWERGVNRPSERYLPLLSEVLNRPVSWFYEPDEPPQPEIDPVERLVAIEAKLDRVIEILLARGGVALMESGARELEAVGRSAAQGHRETAASPDVPNGRSVSG
jgi:transcriptional regulator with XRE-family HTH domain